MTDLQVAQYTFRLTNDREKVFKHFSNASNDPVPQVKPNYLDFYASTNNFKVKYGRYLLTMPLYYDECI